MQKAGHGSLVQTQTGEWYIAHLMSRPVEGTLLNPLGRETSIQKMHWTEDGWLEMKEGSNVAKMEVEGMTGVELEADGISHDVFDDFNQEKYDLHFLTPYRDQQAAWVNTVERPGYLRIHGENSLFSQIHPAIMATRATSLHYEVQTKVEFHPDHYSETAGLGLYYDSNNWLYVHLTHSESEGTVLYVLQAKLGQRIELVHHYIPVPEDTAELKIIYHSGIASILYRFGDNGDWQAFVENIDVLYLSDEGVNGEPGEIGGFTGLFNFIGSVDAHQHDSFADFDYYGVKNY